MPRPSHPIAAARGIVVVVVLWLSPFALGCGEEAAVEAEPVVPAVKTLAVGSGATGATREYSGSLAAWQHSEMAFEVSGKITEFNAVEGQRVEKGFVLAKLDPRDFEAGLLAAEADVAKARADFERYSKLLKEGVASRADFDARKRAFDVSEANLQTAQKAVGDADLVAPFAGVMARKLVEDFQNVSAKEPVLILQDNSSFKIRVTVPEQDMASGRSQNVDVDEITRRIEPKVTVTPLPDRSFDARLYELSLTADPITRTFDATFVMDAPEGSTVLPGMTAKVKIQAPGVSAEGYWVPGRAVWADEAATSYVWKLDPESDRVSRAAVELGAMSGDTIQIVSGLSRDDVIVISGVKTLADGVTVRPLGERIR